MDRSFGKSSESSSRNSKKVKKAKHSVFGNKHEISTEKNKLEFQILQGYRTMDSDMAQQRVQLDRDANISVAIKKLEDVDNLFNRAAVLMGDPEKSNNTILAYDSRALLNVSELTQTSVKNLKLDESKQNISGQDVINSMKKWMLQEYFEETGLDQDIAESSAEESENDEADDNGEEALTQLEIDKRNMTTRLKERNKLSKFKDFNEFDQFNWLKLGALYRQISRKPTLPNHLLGPLQVEKKQRTANRVRLALDPVGAAVTAKSVTNEDMNAATGMTTEEYVKLCFKILKKKRGYESINLFEFILDPNSFSNSVENLFYTSFLIKDGKLIMDEDSDGYPQVRLVPPLPKSQLEKEQELQQRNERSLSHLIFQLDIPTYKELVKEFNITERFLDRE